VLVRYLIYQSIMRQTYFHTINPSDISHGSLRSCQSFDIIGLFDSIDRFNTLDIINPFNIYDVPTSTPLPNFYRCQIQIKFIITLQYIQIKSRQIIYTNVKRKIRKEHYLMLYSLHGKEGPQKCQPETSWVPIA